MTTQMSVNNSKSIQVDTSGNYSLINTQINPATGPEPIDMGFYVSSTAPMSITELIAYLEYRLGKINNSIRDRMYESNVNSAVTRGASQLKTSLKEIGQFATAKQLTDAAAEIDLFLKNSKGSADISESQRKQLEALSASFKDRAAQLNDPKYESSKDSMGNLSVADAATRSREMLDSVITSSGHTDQANLANLQSLVSQMGQATNLVSNMIAAFNEGMKAIVSNTRA